LSCITASVNNNELEELFELALDELELDELLLDGLELEKDNKDNETGFDELKLELEEGEVVELSSLAADALIDEPARFDELDELELDELLPPVEEDALRLTRVDVVLPLVDEGVVELSSLAADELKTFNELEFDELLLSELELLDGLELEKDELDDDEVT